MPPRDWLLCCLAYLCTILQCQAKNNQYDGFHKIVWTVWANKGRGYRGFDAGHVFVGACRADQPGGARAGGGPGEAGVPDRWGGECGAEPGFAWGEGHYLLDNRRRCGW